MSISSRGERLAPGFSFYLDIVRLFAALTVLFCHGQKPAWLFADMKPFRFEHDVVMIFFVLSGYVITYAAETIDKDGRQYAINRLSRILSVTVPAIAFTMVMWMIGRYFRPDLYVQTPAQMTAWAAASLIFINQIWWLDFGIWSQSPYWSVAYEVWFYAIFGLAFFGRGAIRWVATPLLCIVIGPKIMILMPAWLVGVGLYYLHKRYMPSGIAAWAIFIAPIAIYLWLKLNYVREPFFDNPILGSGFCSWMWKLFALNFRFSILFGWDYAVAIFFGTSLFGAPYVMRKLNPNAKASKIVRQLSSMSFSIYLFQAPFLAIASGWRLNISDAIYFPLFYLVILSAIWLLSRVSEMQKSRVKVVITVIFDAVSGTKIAAANVP